MSQNTELLAALRQAFPQLFSKHEEDGVSSEKLDLEKIRLLAGVGNYSDKYGLRWEDKPEQFDADTLGMLPTLTRVAEKAVNSNSAKPSHVLIQGDNYHALKVLTYTHERTVDVIYIDPPYNTGKRDFKYNDRFVDREDGYRHSKWLSFMAKRLKLAKTLLKDTGVIFISIDDNEVCQLKLLCDEIFGEGNGLPFLCRRAKVGGGSDSRHIVKELDYVLVYAKNIGGLAPFFVAHPEKYLSRYKESDEDGRFFWDTYSRPGLQSEGTDYTVTFPDGSSKFSRWKRSSARLESDLKSGDAKFIQTKDGWSLVHKQRLNLRGQKPRQLLIDKMGNGEGKKELAELGLAQYFSYPKPLELLTYLLKLAHKDALVLDFFAGSGTTGHAVMQLNAEDGGERQCILVTNDEGEFKNEAGAFLPGGICTNVTYPRLKKVIEGYSTPNGKAVAGLGENLEFFQTAFQPVPESRDQMRNFVRFSSSMLCMKANAYSAIEESEQWGLFAGQGKHLFLLFDEYAANEAVGRLKAIDGPVEAYVFAYERDDDSAEILSQLPNVTVQEVPQPLLDLFFRTK